MKDGDTCKHLFQLWAESILFGSCWNQKNRCAKCCVCAERGSGVASESPRRALPNHLQPAPARRGVWTGSWAQFSVTISMARFLLSPTCLLSSLWTLQQVQIRQRWPWNLAFLRCGVNHNLGSWVEHSKQEMAMVKAGNMFSCAEDNLQ